MGRSPAWLATCALAAIALLLVSCGGGDEPAPAASQTEQVAQPEEDARVQVIRGRAMLGDPDAPVVIQEYSDFL